MKNDTLLGAAKLCGYKNSLCFLFKLLLDGSYLFFNGSLSFKEIVSLPVFLWWTEWRVECIVVRLGLGGVVESLKGFLFKNIQWTFWDNIYKRLVSNGKVVFAVLNQQ